MRRLSLLVLAAIVAVLAAVIAAPAQALPDCREGQGLALEPCNPSAAGSPTASPSSKPTTSPSSKPSSEATPSADPTSDSSATPESQSGAGSQPDTSAGEWTKEGMKTVRGLNEQIGAAVGKEPMNDNWLPVYAACFGLGLLLMCGALMITIAKSSEGRSVNGFMMLREAGTKSVFFIPLCTLLPGIVMALYNGADQMGEVMMKGAWDSFQRAQSEIESTLEGSVMLGLVFTSPILLLLLVLGIIVFGVMLLLELTIAHYALYVMTCLAPLAAGLSIHPRFKGVATKMFSGMVGVMLVKPALWLAMWIGWDVVYQESDRTDGLAVLTMYLVVLFVSCSVPILTATILPKLLGNDGLEGTSQNLLNRASRAGNAAERRVNQARGFGRGFGSKTGAAQRGAAGANRLGPTASSTKAGGSAAKAGAATGGAGGASRASAAAGPAGMAVAAGVQATAAGHQALTGAIAGKTSGDVDAGGKPDGVSDAVDAGGTASGGAAKTVTSVGGSTSSEVGAAATGRPQGVADATTAGTSAATTAGAVATTTAGAVAAAGTASGAATATGQSTGTTDKPEGDSSAGKATESASAGAVTSSAVSAAGKRVEGPGATTAGTSQAPSRPTGTAASTLPSSPNPGRPDLSGGGSVAPSPAPAGTSKGPDFRYPDSRPAREGSSVMPPAPKQQPPKPPWPGPTPPPPAPTEEQT